MNIQVFLSSTKGNTLLSTKQNYFCHTFDNVITFHINVLISLLVDSPWKCEVWFFYILHKEFTSTQYILMVIFLSLSDLLFHTQKSLFARIQRFFLCSQNSSQVRQNTPSSLGLYTKKKEIHITIQA